MITTQTKTKMSDSERLALKYIETKNILVKEQAIMIALLNQYYTIEIKLPRKRSEKTDNYVSIKSISNSHDTIDYHSMIEDYCRTKMKYDRSQGLSEKTSYRRFTNNKVSEAHHFLMDLLFIHGYKYTSYYSSGKNNSTKTETFTSIEKDGKVLFDMNSIEEKGREINHFLHSLLNESKSYVIKMGELKDWCNFVNCVEKSQSMENSSK